MKRVWDLRRLVFPAAVLVLFAVASLAKIIAFTESPRYDPNSDRLLFWTESALHYRYAKRIALGEGVPGIDLMAQAPEGLDVRRQFTVAMEYAAGYSYRALHGIGIVRAPFHVYLVHFVCWFSSLSIVAVCMAALVLWKSRWAALGAATAYALIPMSWDRTIGNYGREDFALVLLFMFVGFFLRAVDRDATDREWPGRRDLIDAMLAGLFLAIALASWHLSRFFLLIFVPAIPILTLTLSGRARLRNAVIALTLWCAAASLIVPVLREKEFLTAAPMLVIYISTIVLVLSNRSGWSGKKTAGWIVAGSAGLILIIKLTGGYPEYSHVYELIACKLRFLGQKPEDPTLLPFQARSLWVPPFNTPSISYLVARGGVFLAWGCVALIAGVAAIFRGRLQRSPLVIFYLFAVFAVLFLFVQRVSSFYVFFLAVFLPFVIVRSKKKKLLVALFIVSLGWQLLNNQMGAASPMNRLAAALSAADRQSPPANHGNNRRLIEWIRRETPKSAVFLTAYSTGAMVLVDGERAIILHSKFESSTIRERYREFLEALYGSEGDLAALCDSLGATYFVDQINFTLDDSIDSERYEAGLPGIPVRSVAFAMHFFPDDLKRFTVVYQDSYYRVFAFHPERKPPALDHPPAHEEVWETVHPSRRGEYLADADRRRAIDALEERYALIREMNSAAGRGDRDGALEICRRLVAYAPDSEEGAAALGTLLAERGDFDGALAALDHGLAVRPSSAELYYRKGEVLRLANRPYEALSAYSAALARYPGHPLARARMKSFGPAAR